MEERAWRWGGGGGAARECWFWGCLRDGHPLAVWRRKIAPRGLMAARCHRATEEQPQDTTGRWWEPEGRDPWRVRQVRGRKRGRGQKEELGGGPLAGPTSVHLSQERRGRDRFLLGPPARLEEEANLGELSRPRGILPLCPNVSPPIPRCEGASPSAVASLCPFSGLLPLFLLAFLAPSPHFPPPFLPSLHLPPPLNPSCCIISISTCQTPIDTPAPDVIWAWVGVCVCVGGTSTPGSEKCPEGVTLSWSLTLILVSEPFSPRPLFLLLPKARDGELWTHHSSL